MSRSRTSRKDRGDQRGRARSQSAPNTRPGLSDRNRRIVLSLLLGAAMIALYTPVLGYSFVVLDDHDYVTANFHVRAGLTWNTVKWAFTAFTAANWHPLTWLSHALDCQLFALNPAPHHLHNVLLHALNAVLLFLLLERMTKRVGPSLLVAALFAFHPLNVESVAWVAERKNVLSTLFFFLAIAAYRWYADAPGWRRYLLVAGLFAAGLMAKPMVVTLPFVLMLLDYWPLNRVRTENAAAPSPLQVPPSRLLLEKLPLLALSAASAAITVKAQHAGRAVRSLHQFPFAMRMENAVVSYSLYLAKMLWPVHLALYPISSIAIPVWQWLLSASILIAITALTLRLHPQRYLLVGWLWFLGTLVPVIGLVQVGDATMADRYAYIPLIGIFIALAWGVTTLCDKLEVNSLARVIAATCVVIALAAVTVRQMSYWRNEVDLWSHVLAVSDNNPFAHDALGAVLMDPEIALSSPDKGNPDGDEVRMEKARRHLELALAERRQLAQQNPATYLPDMADTLNNLGNLARMENNPESARRYYEEAVEIHSRLAQQNLDPYPADRAMALMNLGYLQKSSQENDKASRSFGDALDIYRQLAEVDPEQYLPSVAEGLNGLAVAEKDRKHMDEAHRDYEEALRIRHQLATQNRETYLPYLALNLNDLGVLDQAESRTNEARQNYGEALALYRQLAQQDPGTYTAYLAGTLNNLGFLYQNQGQIEASKTYYSESLGLYRKLYQDDPQRYAGDVARVEAGLNQLTQTPATK